jgi:hypothetical protein
MRAIRETGLVSQAPDAGIKNTQGYAHLDNRPIAGSPSEPPIAIASQVPLGCTSEATPSSVDHYDALV